MAKPTNLATMSIGALMKLRDDVTEMLGKQAEAIQEQLARLTGLETDGRAPKSKLRGRTVAEKYRDKNGNTWSGRGAQPRWMTAAIKAGAKRDDFLVEKVSNSSTKKGKKSARKTRSAKKAKVAKRAAKGAKPPRPVKNRTVHRKLKASKPAKKTNARARAKSDAAKHANPPIPQAQARSEDVPAPVSAYSESPSGRLGQPR
jgi:DNA-binding protein H-NS